MWLGFFLRLIYFHLMEDFQREDREGGRQQALPSAASFPKGTMAQAVLVWIHKPGASPGYPDACRIQELGLSSAAFPEILVESWIRNVTAKTQASTRMGWWCCMED